MRLFSTSSGPQLAGQRRALIWLLRATGWVPQRPVLLRLWWVIIAMASFWWGSRFWRRLLQSNGTRSGHTRKQSLMFLTKTTKLCNQLDSHSPKTDRKHKETKIPVRLFEIHIGTTCSGQTQFWNRIQRCVCVCVCVKKKEKTRSWQCCLSSACIGLFALTRKSNCPGVGLSRWVHEHCNGTNGRIWQRTTQSQIRGLLYSRKQWCVVYQCCVCGQSVPGLSDNCYITTGQDVPYGCRPQHHFPTFHVSFRGAFLKVEVWDGQPLRCLIGLNKSSIKSELLHIRIPTYIFYIIYLHRNWYAKFRTTSRAQPPRWCPSFEATGATLTLSLQGKSFTWFFFLWAIQSYWIHVFWMVGCCVMIKLNSFLSCTVSLVLRLCM